MSSNKANSTKHLSLERRYQLLVESINDYAIYMITPDGFVASWNPGAQNFKGYTPQEIIGKHFSCFYTPEDRAIDLPATALHTARTAGKFEGEGWRMRKDGTRFWAHIVIDPVIDETGELIGFAKITRDVTDKKLAQDALRDSEERFRLLVKGVSDYAIYMLTPSGEISNWNSGAQRIKGYRDEEVIGSHFSRFYTDADRANGLPAKALATATSQGRFEGEGWRVRKDGTQFWAHVVIDAIYNDRGIMIGFAKITRDITEKRNTEKMLEEARAALVQSQKMDAIGKLTGGIAHDFNNLLQGIMGNLDLMRLRIALGQTAELGHHLDAAISGTKRSAALTHRLLAFARRQTLVPKPVDASWLVHSVMELLRRTVGPDIDIVSDVQDGLWWTLCDQNQLESALLNLVINARDAMPDGGTVTIRTRNLPADEAKMRLAPHVALGDYILLSVSDTGAGMTQDVIEHVFEPFFTTKPFGEGTGLGLSMVHGFVNQSGGYINIESEPGKGTTVNLYFPQHTAVNEPPPRQGTEKDLPLMDRQNASTVLVVDDEEAVRTMLAEMLKQFGYIVLAASDGHEALRLLEASPQVQLLITDIGLPGGMNGRQLANAARQHRPELGILFITGYAEQVVIGNETLPAGMELLIKPFAMDAFASAVQRMVDTGHNIINR